jgi:hypothetical protein
MFQEQCRGLRIDRDAPLLTRLRLLLGNPRLGLGVGTLHDQRLRREVDVPLPQRADLAAAHARDHDDPQEQAPVRVAPCGADDCGGLLGTGWVGSVWFAEGAMATAAGLTPRWRHRTACSSAALMT